MKSKTKEKMDLWLGQHPESTHSLDEKRLFEFVKELCRNNDEAQFEDFYESFRRNHPTYDEEYSRELCEKWDLKVSLLKRFGDFLSEENR